MPSALRSLTLLLCLSALPAAAQVRHCRSADGIDVYTDRRCDELGAAPAPAVPAQPAGNTVYHGGCARTVRDLAFAVQSAIDSRDANLLAASYLWTGLSTRGGYAVMDRLATIAQRPLAGIEPVYPGGDDAQADAPAPAHRAPVALRLEQTLRDGATPANTVLPLRRYLGCWWVSL